MRKLGWLGVLAAVMALSIYAGTPVSGQQHTPQAMPRPYDAAAAGHHRIRRQAGRLQGTAHAVGRPGSAGRLVERRHGKRRHRRRRAAGGGRGAAPEPLLLRQQLRPRRRVLRRCI